MAETLTVLVMRCLRAAFPGTTVALDVPASYKKGRLILVMRTGGQGDRFVERAAYAIDILADTQLDADMLGESARASLIDMDETTGVGRVEVASELENPYPVKGGLRPAYQINITLWRGI